MLAKLAYKGRQPSDHLLAQTQQPFGFGESDGGILFTNESSSHGAGKSGVRMVVHLALAKGPVESWQRSGRCARQACERGVVVHVTSTRSLVQYLQLVKPVGTPLVGTLLLLKQLICDGCLRAAFLTFLGQGSAPYPCCGCDHCARFGAVDGSSSLGCLGYGLVWSRATEAVVALADHWPDKSTLGALLKMGGQHAPSPFDSPDAHDQLLWTLIAEKTVKLSVHAVGEDEAAGCYAVCSLDDERIDDYRNERRHLDVLLLRSWTSSANGSGAQTVGAPRAPSTPDDVADISLVATSLAGSIQRDLDAAAEAVLRAQRRYLSALVQPHAAQVLDALRLSTLHQRLLAAAHVDGPTTRQVGG